MMSKNRPSSRDVEAVYLQTAYASASKKITKILLAKYNQYVGSRLHKPYQQLFFQHPESSWSNFSKRFCKDTSNNLQKANESVKELLSHDIVSQS